MLPLAIAAGPEVFREALLTCSFLCCADTSVGPGECFVCSTLTAHALCCVRYCDDSGMICGYMLTVMLLCVQAILFIIGFGLIIYGLFAVLCAYPAKIFPTPLPSEVRGWLFAALLAVGAAS